MKNSLWKTMVLVIAVVLLTSGCAVRSQFDVDAKARYQPTVISPPQVADVHVTWKITIN